MFSGICYYIIYLLNGRGHAFSNIVLASPDMKLAGINSCLNKQRLMKVKTNFFSPLFFVELPPVTCIHPAITT